MIQMRQNKKTNQGQVHGKRNSICVILPALNEELTVGKVIDEIPRQTLETEGYQLDVIVVDSNSNDRTKQFAQDRGARVIIEPRRGKGRAVRTALDLIKADFIFMLDADYTYPATHITDMLRILRLGQLIVIGSRLKGKREKGAMSRLNLIGNMMLSLLARVLYRVKISDVCTGCWGIRGEIIPKLNLSTDGFQFEAELFAELAKNGYQIAEVPIYYRRRGGKTKLLLIVDGLKIGYTLITKRFA